MAHNKIKLIGALLYSIALFHVFLLQLSFVRKKHTPSPNPDFDYTANKKILIEEDDNDRRPETRTRASSTSTKTKTTTIQKRKLEFIHITKTGGSAIEREASMKNITWGACHYIKMEYNGIGCQNPDLHHRLRGYNASNVPFNFVENFGEPWHIPSHWLNHHPYKDDDTFTVVRDPYSRAISQFYCKYKGFKAPAAVAGAVQMNQMNNATVMNGWLQDLFNSTKVKLAHFLPQHYYVYDKEGNKVVDHVLKHGENLNDDFSKLMIRYDINISLPSVKFNARNSSSSLTVGDLTPETIRLINHVYRDDFVRFNYTMIDEVQDKDENKSL